MGFGKHVTAAGLILLLALSFIVFLNATDNSRLLQWQVQAPQIAVLGGDDDIGSRLDWQRITLPADWYQVLEPEQRVALRFPWPDHAADQQTVLLTHSARAFSVWLDDDRLFEPELPVYPGRVFTSAHWFTMNRDQQTKAQQITLVLPASQNGTASIGRLYFGPADTLIEIGEHSNFVKHTLSSLIVFTMLLSALFVFGLWVLRPLDTIYLWYALAVVCWAIYSYGHLPVSLPIDVRQWDWFRLTALNFWPVLVVVFCNRFTNRPQPVIESLLA